MNTVQFQWPWFSNRSCNLDSQDLALCDFFALPNPLKMARTKNYVTFVKSILSLKWEKFLSEVFHSDGLQEKRHRRDIPEKNNAHTIVWLSNHIVFFINYCRRLQLNAVHALERRNIKITVCITTVRLLLLCKLINSL